MAGPHGRPKGDGITDVERLTNAAISAAMAEERLYGESPEIGYRDGQTMYVNSDGILRWSDGHPYGPPEINYRTETWEPWREAIASLLEPWEARPTLGPFYDQVQAMTKAAQLLRPAVEVDGEGTDAGVQGGGDLRDAILSLRGDLSGMRGTTIWRFRTRYADHLHTINEGQFGLAYVLGECIAAEQAIWDKADLDYRDLVSQATQAFLAARDFQIYGGGGGDFSTDLTVAGAILSGIGLFASGGLSTAVSVGAFAVSLLEQFAGEEDDVPEPTITGETANQVMESFSSALDELRDTIAKQEDAIGACLEENLDTLSRAPEKFDLASPPLLDQDDPEQIGFEVDTWLMRQCGNVTCPRVARAFSGAASAAEGGFGAGPWQRPAYFGATSGSYPAYARLLSELQYAAENSGYEIESAGRLFALTADYFDESDTSSSDALAGIRRLVRHYDDAYPEDPSPQG